MGFILSASIAMLVWQAVTAEQILLLVALGLSMLCGQFLLIQAFKRANASFVTPITYSTLLFVTAYDFYFFNVVLDSGVIFGAALIVVGVFVLSLKR